MPGDDKRSSNLIESAIKDHHLPTNLQKIENEPEESFELASVHTRNMTCPTWLGISRDMRIFEISTPQDMDMIIPRMASSPVNLPEINNSGVTYGYMTGRGQSVENNRVRWRIANPVYHTNQWRYLIQYYFDRIFDVYRRSLLEQVLPEEVLVDYNPEDYLFPIPSFDAEFIVQNPGYE